MGEIIDLRSRKKIIPKPDNNPKSRFKPIQVVCPYCGREQDLEEKSGPTLPVACKVHGCTAWPDIHMLQTCNCGMSWYCQPFHKSTFGETFTRRCNVKDQEEYEKQKEEESRKQRKPKKAVQPEPKKSWLRGFPRDLLGLSLMVVACLVFAWVFSHILKLIFN